MGRCYLRVKFVILVSLATLAYLPILRLPFISDDFTQIPIAGQYLSSWHQLLSSPELCTRLTYVLLDGGLLRGFGFTPVPFYISSILLHVLCTLLVYSSGTMTSIGWRRSFWAACFFAVFEGHQEAVMWIAASMELFLFLFGIGAILLWDRWLREGQARWYALSLVCFVLAMSSKESVWIFPALMCLVGIMERLSIRKVLVSVAPFALLASAYALWVFNTRSSNGRFKDGSFSLRAPWLANNLDSLWHLLVIWGILALAVIVARRGVGDLRIAGFSCLWMSLSLLPYSFLTYMPRVPSRQTYLASLGLAWLVAAAIERVRDEFPRLSAIAMAAVVLINVEILWVKKLGQFRERAEPTELLRSAAKQAVGPIHILKIPVDPMVARAALEDDHHTAVVDDVQVRRQRCAQFLYLVQRSEWRGKTRGHADRGAP